MNQPFTQNPLSANRERGFVVSLLKIISVIVQLLQYPVRPCLDTVTVVLLILKISIFPFMPLTVRVKPSISKFT